MSKHSVVETPVIDAEGTRLLAELAGIDVEVDGLEALHQLVAEILGQISTQDSWAGRAAPLEAPHACGACGRWQQVLVPFLHHACESCHALWVPGHCSNCGRTASTLASDFDAARPPQCSCGSPQTRLGIIPRQRALDAPVEDSPGVEVVVVAARRVAVGARVAGVAAGILSIIAAVAIIGGQGSSAAAPAVPAARPVVVAGSPAALGLATRDQLMAHHEAVTLFTCTSKLPALPAAEKTAFLTSCAGN